MSAFAQKVAAVTGVPENRLARHAGGVLSELLLVQRLDGRLSVAKGGSAVAAEAEMLRSIRRAGIPAPDVEGEHDGVLLLEYLSNDGIFSPAAWRDLGTVMRRLHDLQGDRYGWPTDYWVGTVEFVNRFSDDWPSFWAEQRLIATAGLLDRPWRLRVDRLAGRLDQLLPQAPPASHLHGDLWTGNILVETGHVAGLIDPACYFGHAEVDLAMLSLFDLPSESFWETYGPRDAGWHERLPIYQLFPALVHMRLFGASYAEMADRLLRSVGC